MEGFSALNFVAIPAITAIVFLLCQWMKILVRDTKLLPAFAGTAGAFISLAAFLLIPAYHFEDVLTALAVGIASGFAATGIHQAFKQLSDKGD